MNTQVLFLVAVPLIHSVCGSYSGNAYSNEGYSGDYGHDDLRYHGPTAIPHVLHDGHIADTHEVATAKAEHYKAVATARSHSGYGHGGSYGYGHDDLRYHGPTAIPHVLHDGHIADTHEVAAAKTEHYKAVATARSHSGYGHGGSYGYGGYGHDSSYAGAYHTAPYHGPLARPVVLKSGYLADTHEVSAAKAAHHTAVVSARSHSGYGSEGFYGYGGEYNHGGNYGYSNGLGYGGSYGGYGHGSSANYHTTPYHGPLAKPVVLKSGYLADTHEVATAKAHHLRALHYVPPHYGYNKW